MSDEAIRRLERLAMQGDPEAIARLGRLRQRTRRCDEHEWVLDHTKMGGGYESVYVVHYLVCRNCRSRTLGTHDSPDYYAPGIFECGWCDFGDFDYVGYESGSGFLWCWSDCAREPEYSCPRCFRISCKEHLSRRCCQTFGRPLRGR